MVCIQLYPTILYFEYLCPLTSTYLCPCPRQAVSCSLTSTYLCLCPRQAVSCSLSVMGFGESVMRIAGLDNAWVAKGVGFLLVVLLVGKSGVGLSLIPSMLIDWCTILNIDILYILKYWYIGAKVSQEKSSCFFIETLCFLVKGISKEIKYV